MGSHLSTMEWKGSAPLVLLLITPLSCLSVTGYPYLVPRSPTSYLVPANYIHSPYRPPSFLPYAAPANARVICSSCSCDEDFFCAFNCPKCSADSFCSSCSCLTSLGCAKNCASCAAQAQDQPGASSGSSASSCVASSGPAAGKPCIFPFIYNGVQYQGCTQLISGLASVYSSPTFWCSTKVDVNGFHVRGPWDNQGVRNEYICRVIKLFPYIFRNMSASVM